MTSDPIPFVLATASISGSPAFPLVVLDDEAAIAVAALAPLAAKLGRGLSGSDSLHGLLQDWDRNRAGLGAAVQALDDAELGKYTRSSVTALEFFDLLAPLSGARQVIYAAAQTEARPSSSLAGPRAKVPVPSGETALHAGLAAGVVIGAPSYQASESEARHAIAGLTVTTTYQGANGETWCPGFLPLGPYIVPRPFCDDTLTGRIAFNGETGHDATAALTDAISAVQRASAKCQLFPGDLIILPLGAISNAPLGDGDIIETAIAGLGQQTTNIMVESKHAHSGN